MDIESKVTFFRDMVACCHNLYLWAYDSGFHLIESNCPNQAVINDLFVMSRRQGKFDSQITEQDTPIILNNEIGLLWMAMPQFEDGDFVRLYVLGPFFVDDILQKNLETHLARLDLNPQLCREFLVFLHGLPIISLNRIFEYAIMLHFCVTGKKITVSDLRYQNSSLESVGNITQREQADAHGTYKAEQEMLRFVREGDMNYQRHMDKISVTGRLGKLSNDDPLRQMKNTVLVCITLFSRAAIEGGLTPEVSYTLTDYYFQSVEACPSIAELPEIAHTMQADFVERVHRCHTSRLSPPIRLCCDYISLHLEDKLSLSDLARQTGYTEYYLSKKFKRETDLSPVAYIRRQRLDRAALLLRTTTEDVQDISAKLHFCSQSYFSEHFRKLYGVSPTEYRLRKN